MVRDILVKHELEPSTLELDNESVLLENIDYNLKVLSRN